MHMLCKNMRAQFCVQSRTSSLYYFITVLLYQICLSTYIFIFIYNNNIEWKECYNTKAFLIHTMFKIWMPNTEMLSITSLCSVTFVRNHSIRKRSNICKEDTKLCNKLKISSHKQYHIATKEKCRCDRKSQFF